MHNHNSTQKRRRLWQKCPNNSNKTGRTSSEKLALSLVTKEEVIKETKKNERESERKNDKEETIGRIFDNSKKISEEIISSVF